MLPSGFSDIVLDVLPFGAGLRQPDWYGNHRYAIIDAAASFDALHGFGRIFKPKTNVAIIVSLHATKMLGAGEGGIVYVNDPEIASKIRSFCNFGFDSRSGLRHSKSFGSNLKMSEYSAAVALASFSRWDEVRQDSIQRIGIARSISKRSGFSVHSAMDEGYANPYWIIRSGEEELISSLLEKSREHKVDVRKWWGIGCHTMPAYSSIRRDKLPITERVGSRYLGLPFHRFLKTDDWNRIELFLGSI